MRIGMLTGGGDCPGLNAVIRAVVRKGIDGYGDEIVGFRDGWRGVLEDSHGELTIESTRGILPRGGTILGSSRTNPYKRDDGVQRVRDTLEKLRLDGLIAIGGEDTLGVANRLHQDGVQRGRRPQDDRQRSRRHRRHVRVRHRAAHRHRGDRPAAHDRREPQPDPRGRGDGPDRGLDRAALGRRRRRRRDPDPGDPVRHRRGVPADPPASRARPVLLDRRRGRGRDAEGGNDAGRARRGRSTSSAIPGWAGSGTRSSARSRTAPATRPARPCSATSSAAAPRPRSTGCSRPGSGWPRSTRRTTARGG